MNLVTLLQNQPAHILWLLVGLGFLGIAMLVAEPTVSALGIAALITAIAALTVPSLGIQLLIWGILSVSLSVVLRGLVPRESRDLRPPTEAEVSRTIPSGGTGEVSYEGSLWRARCQVSDVAIAVGQIVHVVGRQGNTLIVLPSTFPDHPVYDQTA
jgi:membrane protein implicated in regulation of membrane protease activity